MPFPSIQLKKFPGALLPFGEVGIHSSGHEVGCHPRAVSIGDDDELAALMCWCLGARHDPSLPQDSAPSLPILSQISLHASDFYYQDKRCLNAASS